MRPHVPILASMLVLAAQAAQARLSPACDREAAPLSRPAVVRGAARAGAPARARLPEGRPVYLCEIRHGWRRIAYPRAGERADCASRPASRRCPTGWIGSRHPTRPIG